MVSCILDKRGLSLLEVISVMSIMIMLIAIIISNYTQRINQVLFQKTVAEMKAIAQAAIDFDLSQGFCPTDINQLSPAYMPRVVTSSPFNSNYQLSCAGNMVSISNLIPAGLAQKNPEGQILQVINSGIQDNITLTQTMPNSFTARLQYDKKYL